jgi:sortase (surface protein transpeptidase)
VTDGLRPGERVNDWRRRHLPAALFVLAAGVALLAVLNLVSRSGHDEPPAGRRLPHRAFASERPEAPAQRIEPTAKRRLVDVVDREAARPRAIRIPAIGVSARVIPLGLNPDGTMQTPQNFSDTGWYKPWREPGERGTAVITGHVDSVDGPAVFYRLRDLRRGNIIRIARADGSVVRFRVEGLERWPKAEFPTRRVFRRTRTAALRLVTCSGNFDASTGHYVDNTIVYAARMRVRRTIPPPAP